MEHADSAQIAFYLERARDQGQSALDLGCGTGVVAVALALAGIEVTAFDPSEALVAQAVERRRAHGIAAERCRIEHSDLRSLRIARRFGFVYAPSNALLSLPTLDDLIAVFATATAHLTPSGTFAFDIRQEPSFMDDERPTRSLIELRSAHVRRPHLRERGASAVHRLTLLSVTPEEIDAALTANGLQALERWGGFGGAEYSPDAERMVLVAGRAPAR